MEFIPTPKQDEAHVIMLQNRITLYGGAIRGAKSYWGIMEIITMCFDYPKSRHLMLRESMPTMKRNLLNTFQNYFLDCGLAQYVADFNHTDMVLRWANGSEILFMSENYADDKELNRFKGLEFNSAFIDEINEIQEITFNKVIERCGSWFKSPGCPNKILASCNPTQNWVKAKFYNPWKTGTLPPGFAYVPAKITDNPHIPKDYIEGLKLLPRYQYEVFVNGDWDIVLKTGGEFYKCFDLDRHVRSGIFYNPKLPLHITFDDNVNPYLPCGVYQIEGKEIFCIDEIAGVNPGNTVKAVCFEIARKYPAHAAGMFIYGDSTANKEDTKLEKGFNFYRLILDNLKQYKPTLRLLPANQSVVMRGNWINTVLEKELGGIKIIVGQHCTKTINDFVLLKEAADGTKLKEMETDPTTKVRYQKVGHFSDAFDYLLTTAFMQDFINYQKGGITTSIMQGRNKSKNAY